MTPKATIMYTIYAAGFVVGAWVVMQLRVWRAQQDRRIIEASAEDDV